MAWLFIVDGGLGWSRWRGVITGAFPVTDEMPTVACKVYRAEASLGAV